MPLSGSVHFGVINEMSCQTDGWGEPKRKNELFLVETQSAPHCSPGGLGAWQGGASPPTSTSAPVWPSGWRGRGADSSLPIFSSVAERTLFYVFISARRESPAGACPGGHPPAKWVEQPRGQLSGATFPSCPRRLLEMAVASVALLGGRCSP